MKIIQLPNPPLIVALGASSVSMVTRGVVQATFRAIFFTALTIWAYEEVVHGANWFRRSLGAVVAGCTLYSLAMRLFH